MDPVEKPWSRRATIVVALVIVATLIANRAVFPLNPVVEDVSVELLWRCSTGVKAGAEAFDGIGSFVGCDDEWCYASEQWIHRSVLLRTPRPDLKRALPKLMSSSRRAVESGQPGLGMDTAAIVACYDASTELDVVRRFAECRTEAHGARLASMRGREALGADGALAREMERTGEIDKLRHQLAFEGAWLAMLIAFIAWPAVRRQRAARWAARVALAPTAFMLPVWLGYQPWLKTSVGPTGGALYSLLARGVPATSWSLDREVLRRFPPLFEGLSISPGEVISCSGGGMLGPVTALIVGALAGVAVLQVARRVERRRA